MINQILADPRCYCIARHCRSARSAVLAASGHLRRHVSPCRDLRLLTSIRARTSLVLPRDLRSDTPIHGVIPFDGTESRGHWRERYRASSEAIMPGGAEGNAIVERPVQRPVLLWRRGRRMIRGSTSTVCRRSSCLMSCWTVWGAGAHRRPPRPFTLAAGLAMRACVIPPIRRPSRRLSR
jgi:hypothetical protein